MAKELMEIGGFITEGAEIVNHDNSLSGNGTVDSPLGVVPGYNETVLFSGDLTASSTAQLTESWKNFEEIRCYGYSGPAGAMFGCGRTNDLLSAYSDTNWCPDIGLNTVASWVHRDNFSINANMPLVFSADNSVASLNGRLLGYWNNQWQLSTNEQRCHCTLILGINRKA